MKTRIRILCLAMAMLIFSGCGGKAGTAAPQPPGTLAAIEYGRRVDMVWGENFSVRVAPGTILTPAARDFLREQNIVLIEEATAAANEAAEAANAEAEKWRKYSIVFVDKNTGK